MGKSQNPVEAHRRKQHLKEIKKNKEKRIHERDDKVKKLKSVVEVQREIKELEKRHKHQLGQHDVKSKLDRLKKELKLVQESEAQKLKEPKSVRYDQSKLCQARSTRNFRLL
jgi:WW domain binding protein 11